MSVRLRSLGLIMKIKRNQVNIFEQENDMNEVFIFTQENSSVACLCFLDNIV